MPVYASDVFFHFFENAGSEDMAVNGSVTPVNFDIVATAGALIRRVCVLILDGTINSRENFAGLVAPLANGLEVKVVDGDDTELVDFLDGRTIVKNADWDLLAGVDSPAEAGAGDDSQSVRWTLFNGLGDFLDLKPGDKLRVTVNDDLSAIPEFRMFAQGILPSALSLTGTRAYR